MVEIKNQGVLLCGIGYYSWRNDTVSTTLANYQIIHHFKTKEAISGSYCFTYMEIKRKNYTVRSTNEFKLEE